MKEIVVISGKGGTGKTSLTASFAYIAGSEVVVADCDVDAADMHLLLKPDFANSNDYYSGYYASNDNDGCIHCGACKDACHFGAINDLFEVDLINCEGCGYCHLVCPTKSMKLLDRHVGHWFESSTRMNNTLVHARLGIAADNSGKLVATVKKEARRIAKEENIDTLLVDGSPGIGCPVVSSLSGANLVVLVTEPTKSGFHDLMRVYKLVKSFNINASCIINKSDLNSDVTSDIEQYLKDENIVHLANLPYDEMFTEAMTQGKTIVEYDQSHIKEQLEECWNKIKEIV